MYQRYIAILRNSRSHSVEEERKRRRSKPALHSMQPYLGVSFKGVFSILYYGHSHRSNRAFYNRMMQVQRVINRSYHILPLKVLQYLFYSLLLAIHHVLFLTRLFISSSLYNTILYSRQRTLIP